MDSRSAVAALRRIGLLLASCVLGGAIVACSEKVDYGGGLLPFFQPAYVAITFPYKSHSPCYVGYSLDGVAADAIGDGVVFEVTPGPHTLTFGVGGLSPEGCECEIFPASCEMTARKGKVVTVRLHMEPYGQGSLCCPQIFICYYSPLVGVECPQ